MSKVANDSPNNTVQTDIERWQAESDELLERIAAAKPDEAVELMRRYSLLQDRIEAHQFLHSRDLSTRMKATAAARTVKVVVDKKIGLNK